MASAPLRCRRDDPIPLVPCSYGGGHTVIRTCCYKRDKLYDPRFILMAIKYLVLLIVCLDDADMMTVE